jgi:hypothetical protein
LGSWLSGVAVTAAGASPFSCIEGAGFFLTMACAWVRMPSQSPTSSTSYTSSATQNSFLESREEVMVGFSVLVRASGRGRGNIRT